MAPASTPGRPRPSRTVAASTSCPGTNVTAECRGCGEITDLIQGSDWCWTCVYTDPPYIDYAGRPTLAGDDTRRTRP